MLRRIPLVVYYYSISFPDLQEFVDCNLEKVCGFFKKIKKVGSIEPFIVFTAAAFYLAIMPWSVRFD